MKKLTNGILAIILCGGLVSCSANPEMEDEQDPAIDSQQTVHDESSGNEKVANGVADIQEEAETFRVESKETLAEMKRDLDLLGNTVDRKTAQIEDDADNAAEKLEESTEEALEESSENTEEVQESAEESTDTALANLRADIDKLEARIDSAKFETKSEYEAFATEVKKKSQQIQTRIEKLRNDADNELEEAIDSDKPSNDS